MYDRIKNGRRYVLVALAVGLVLALSLGAAMLMDVQSRRHKLEALICRARTAAFSFSDEELRQLDGVSAENNQHLYRNMRRKLTQLAGPGRGHSRAFLTRLKKGEVFFLAASGVGKPVEAGQKYSDAPKIMMSVFSRGRAEGNQDVKDNWGRWAAACAPVVQPHTGQVVAVLGMYVEASYWRQQFHYSFILTNVYGVILAVITALFFGLKWRDRKVRDVLQMTHQRLILEIGTRQKAQKDLRFWKNRYRKTERFVPHVLLETDANGILSFVRARGADRIPLHGGLAIGGHILDLVIPEQRKRASHCLRKVIQGHHRVDEKFTVATKASMELTVSVSGSPMRSKGQIVGSRWVAVEPATPKKTATTPFRGAISSESLTRLDTLTGLPSRFLFQRQLKEAIRRSMELEGLLVLLCLDIDRFKQFNDGHGREMGDRVLCEMARRLKKVLRSTDTVARLGGDEFMIILEEVKNCDDIRIVVGKLQVCLGVPMEIDGVSHTLSVSIGSSIMPQEGIDAQKLQQSADLAMCKAKKLGRDTYQIFSWTDDCAIPEAIMGERLSQALERNELEILYQPRMYLSSGKLGGFEASFCWQHPVRGKISSPQIAAWAREGGFLFPLWEWYFSAVCRQTRSWQKELGFSGSMAVNLFSEQVGLPWLADRIEHLRAASGVDPSRIVLQIGEEVLAEERPSVLRTMHGLHSAGFTLAVVDFGKDDSCLKYLTDLPVSLIKIENSVVQKQWSGEKSDCCINLMVSAAHRLGVEVAMAGISVVDQMVTVQSLGCDLVQGPLFGGAQASIFIHDKLLRSRCSDLEKRFVRSSV